MNELTGQKKIKSTGLIVVIILGVLVVLAIAALIFFFIRYRQSATLHTEANQTRVIITEPGNMAQFPAGSPITVLVNAFGQQPITSTELWINGVLEGVQAGPPGGLAQLTTQFSWIPPQGGNFSLVARAVDQAGGMVTSSAVIAFITSPAYGDQPDPEAGKVNPVVLPAAPAGQPSPNPSSPGEVPVPADEWQGSPGDWLTDLFTQSAPAEPELVVTANGCDITLNIHDLSENEEGFALYRQTTNSPDWVHAVDLASHPGTGWLEYQEYDLAGGITYYVTAFNSQGEASSNLALVNIDPQVCPPDVPLIENPSLHFKPENMSINPQTKNMYCYTHLGKNLWTRWPEAGFLNSGENVAMLPQLVRPILLADLDKNGVINPVTGSLDLKVECWGWQNGLLVALGNIQELIDLVNPKRIHTVLSGAEFDISPESISSVKREGFMLGEGEFPTLSLDPYYVENLGFVPESDQMPNILAWVSYDPDICKDHMLLPSDKEFYCAPMPGFNKGPGGLNPQPYLVWYVLNGGCPAYPDKECYTLDWWQHFANSNPYPYYSPGFSFIVDSQGFSADGSPAGGIGEQVDLTQWARRILPDEPMPNFQMCHDGQRIFEVSLYAETGVGRFKNYSNQVYVPCVEELGDSVDIEVEFYSLTLDNIDDGYNADLTSDETADYVYGTFGTNPVGKPGNPHMGYININEIDDCYFNYEMGGYGCGSYGNGGYLLKDVRLCTIDSDMCSLDEKFLYNNNKIIVTLKDQSALQLFVNLNEWDYLEDDNVCFGQAWLGPWPLSTWASLDDSLVRLIMNDNGDASCAVEVILNAVPIGK